LTWNLSSEINGSTRVPAVAVRSGKVDGKVVPLARSLDIAQHIANGMKQSHGWDETATMSALRKHFNVAIKERAPGLVGTYVDEH
jgi:hypothetical protein